MGLVHGSRPPWHRLALLVGLAVLASACRSTSQTARPAAAGSASVVGHVAVPSYQGKMFPPSSHGANNPALNKGLTFTVPEIDDLADFHGSLSAPKLVLYVGGDYYFAMPALVSAFQALHSSLKGASTTRLSRRAPCFSNSRPGDASRSAT